MDNDRILNALTSRSLTYRQRFSTMAKIAEDFLSPIQYSKKTEEYLNNNVIFDMGEGKAPYRPRYCVPDYELFMKQGSDFLDLKPPTDIWEAIGNLLCLYHNIPGVNGTPAYIGMLDQLLEPFVRDTGEATKAIHLLLQHVNSTISDAFCHADIGPYATEAGRIILDLTAEMQKTSPNMTMIYREDTPDEWAQKAISTALIAAKPSFANDRMYRQDMGRYAVVSCYNVLPVGGNGVTLVRLNIHKLTGLAGSAEKLLNQVLPDVVDSMCEVIDKRCRYIIEDCGFFENSFLYREGLIQADAAHSIGMFGYVGLAECVNSLLGGTEKHLRFGQSDEADELGAAIMEKIFSELKKHSSENCTFALHAQVGIAEDKESSPGGRIPIGDEPDMPRHIRHFSRMHKYCAAGCGEIFPFEETAKKNPEAVLDILKGAFALDARYISFYSCNADLVRISGYLAKRSDMEKYKSGQAVVDSAAVLGLGAQENARLLERKVRGEDRG